MSVIEEIYPIESESERIERICRYDSEEKLKNENPEAIRKILYERYLCKPIWCDCGIVIEEECDFCRPEKVLRRVLDFLNATELLNKLLNEICIGMRCMDLPVLVMLTIVEQSYRRIAEERGIKMDFDQFSYYNLWEISKKVKHYV